MLADELTQVGAETVREMPAGVLFTGTRAVMYRACLWSRLANRILLPLGEGPAKDAQALYNTVAELPWEKLFRAGASIAVIFSGTNADLRNTRFGAQRCKDAILDRCRRAAVELPAVRPTNPDITVSVRLRGDVADIALDLVGESLHRRGYRRGSGEAPIKENLAAALLMRAGWPALLREIDAALIDPMCGSATFLIEGAMMALDRAPGLSRESFAFEAWAEHEPSQWSAVQGEARTRGDAGATSAVPEIRGYDADPRVIRRAQENIAAAGLSKHVRVSVKAVHEVRKPTHRSLKRGLLITNPPYGERMGNADTLPKVYRGLGELAAAEFQGWEAAILAPNAELGKALGLRSHKNYAFLNGRLPVTLYLLTLIDNRLADVGPGAVTSTILDDPEVPAMLVNRLRKNQRRLKPWLKRSGVSCYRLYDADIPEYAIAVDLYEDRVHVAEYRAPADIPAELSEARLSQALAAVREVCAVPESHLVLKRRERQRGSAQYERLSRRGDLIAVREASATLLVNLNDYLDTGLFLDHRPLRLRIGREARDKRFLNLYCYTGAATIHAALGGARETVSVDLSKTYLEWFGKNLAQNRLAEDRHRRVKGDVGAWLEKEIGCYDLILLDPPSFSNSKSLDESFDVQRDHFQLVLRCMDRLDAEGTLYFSTNRRRFRLDAGIEAEFAVEDITPQTLDPDFNRSPPPHRCWRIRHQQAVG